MIDLEAFKAKKSPKEGQKTIGYTICSIDEILRAPDSFLTLNLQNDSDPELTSNSKILIQSEEDSKDNKSLVMKIGVRHISCSNELILNVYKEANNNWIPVFQSSDKITITSPKQPVFWNEFRISSKCLCNNKLFKLIRFEVVEM